MTITAPPLTFAATLTGWFEGTLLSAARAMIEAGCATHRLDERIADILRREPLQPWEVDRWVRGIRHNMLSAEEHFFRVKGWHRSAMSLFVRNDAGLNVGLRREAITQIATYVSLITDLGYPRARTRFEMAWMDVVVVGAHSQAYIYAENKAAGGTLEKLCDQLATRFVTGIPRIPADGTVKPKDAEMKALHIWRNRPRYFWAVAPTRKHSFAVQYTDKGFALEPIDNIPAFHGLDADTVTSF